jgi:myb proto-oncogene protein
MSTVKVIGRWQAKEDRKLRALVEQYGERWTYISSLMEGRCASQCRERWVSQLQPGINSRRLNAQEKELVLELQRKHGNKWKFIASHLPGRTSNLVKNFYHGYQRVLSRAYFSSDATTMPTEEEEQEEESFIDVEGFNSEEDGEDDDVILKEIWEGEDGDFIPPDRSVSTKQVHRDRPHCMLKRRRHYGLIQLYRAACELELT